MAVTIKDVAALAGVSPSTVSRTCKNNPSISEETKERVRRAMAELGYEPNFQASNLAAQISRSIGIILPPSPKETYENSFYLETIRGSATTVTHISISAPLLPVRMKKRSLTQYVPCPEAVRLTDLLFFIPV